MKVFISYGHNDYTELVDRVFDALSAKDHTPWKDDRYEGHSGIAPGQDFTQVIYDAIDASDFVIAFVSRATQRKQYCCDERTYAYNHKGSHFIQLRIEDIEIKLGNSRSYIDMSKVVETTGEINEKLFSNAMNALFAAFRDPKSLAEGGTTPWTKIDTHLKVPGALKYDDFVATLDNSDFVGREWLFEKCKSWSQDSSISRRLFVILGEAGTGKSAFVRRLATDAELVRAVHICVYDKPSTRTAKDTLKDLAYMLAQNNIGYFEFLKSENLEKLRDMELDSLFEYLFLEPLKNESEKYLLIIDGLDELEEITGLKPLMQVFNLYAHRINPNISFLVTSRPEEYIITPLRLVGAGRPLETVSLTKDMSRDDLLLYINTKLRGFNRYSDALSEKILLACDGNFEYLALLFREAEQDETVLDESNPLPAGLNERFIHYLHRDMSDGFSEMQFSLISLLCAAREPLPRSLLADVLGATANAVQAERNNFGSLIRLSGDNAYPCLSLFTKSFRDFLLSGDHMQYRGDRSVAAELFTRFITENCRREKDLERIPYLDRHGFYHLLLYAARNPRSVIACLERLALGGVDIASRIADALECGDSDVINAYFDISEDVNVHYAVLRRLNGKRARAPLSQLSVLHEEADQVFDALVIRADMLIWSHSQEDEAEARKLYEEALRTADTEHLIMSDAKSARDLAAVYTRLGEIAWNTRTEEGRAEAEALYRKALALYEDNHKASPDYETRRDLSCIYEYLGVAESKKKTPESLLKARELYQKRLELCEMNYRSNPCYETRRDLSFTYARLGELFWRSKTDEGLREAESCYRKAAAMDEKNYKDAPCYESRRDLSSTYNWQAYLERQKNTEDSRIASAARYREIVLLDEQNYSENPCFESRRVLSIAYSRLANAILENGGAEASGTARALYLKMLDLHEENCKEAINAENLQNLSSVYGALSNLARQEGTANGLTNATEWCKKRLAVAERCHTEFPTERSKRELISVLSKLAELSRQSSSPEA
ncbi:MAG: TIR domain-containing protein [Clostridia bacterium]|nr:TIR domain-containing protein [Clostridia bacterium]